MSDWFYKTHPFNVNHPERREGERWLTNDVVGPGYTYAGAKTLRVGVHAYDVDGVVMPGMSPIFVSEDEFEQITTRVDKRDIGESS